ncbi:MAG TPA: hypothetical protein ENK06_00205, partial [Gammaproteobacteria bacterium]|nr:hypothetical protein [Gammaproteobacteria bacterium]
VLFFYAASAIAQVVPRTPLTDRLSHTGVMGCYGSTCHSRQEATGETVRQNEILTWQDKSSVTGAHSRAYKTLLNERSASIAKRLNIGPAYKALACLSCHTDAVPKSLQKPTFQIDDGVSCESCHGGSQKWLKSHYNKNVTHDMNVASGLYPLEDAQTRANVCLSCHLGSETKGQFVNHRLMAAGHPRLSFELDLFTALQSHHSEDYDYAKRKTVQSGARIWAIGQAMTLKQQLRLFQNDSLNKDGIFPELVFFDCLACHRTISDDPDWRPKVRPNPGRPLAPGLVKFNDASMIMLLATAQEIAPDLARQFENNVKNFHLALSESPKDQSNASVTLVNITNELVKRIEKTNFSKEQTLGILNVIVTDTLLRRYTDYVAAEQAIMAIDTLLSSMISSRQVPEAYISDMRAEINTAYDAVENPNQYDQDKLTSALKVLQRRLEALK